MTYPTDIYMSPRKAIQRFSQIMQRCHPEAMKVGRNYREEKEALIAAEVLFGIEKLYGVRYWLQNAEHIAKDYDIKAVRKIPGQEQFGEAAFLQITEYESHNTSIIDVLKAKQKPGYNPGQLELVISLRDRGGETFDPVQLARDIAQTNPKYRAVWLVTDDASDEWLFHLVRLYPDLVRAQFNVQKAFDNSSPPDYIRELPKYGQYTQVTGEYELPLPPCPVCGKV